MLNGKKDGTGKIIFPSGDTYEGEWKDNQEHGWGINTWVDGQSYIG
jgi:hypothetical protein